MPVRLAPERADAIAAGLESGGGPLVFRGGQGRGGGTTWLAEVGIQPGDCAAEWLDVKVSCKVRGREVFDGEFRLCGATAQIKGGEGRLSREALARGLAEGGVSFAPSGGRAISGTPVFGELM
ncbi:MAG: hypothetical protein IJQ73_07155 [Kiritimatiellae bacterium]|nr:hypothetical protein [Kiritimatiellia bacterium]